MRIQNWIFLLLAMVSLIAIVIFDSAYSELFFAIALFASGVLFMIDFSEDHEP